ncbi:hypothetical protein WJX84_006808 [Apatococcus fuscideae]|uniref:Glucose-6-phosphate 1-dehydrogenase n=1 Tax=Apatococcus fuscideae TaxID=2026836 RepID=A0AAW1T7T5_9CHLO
MGSFKRSASNNSLSASARDDIKYEVSDNLAFTVVVLGASGDLAKKKTFPALFTLFDKGFLPKDLAIIGYARSALDINDLRKKIKGFLKSKDEAKKDEFVQHITYVQGAYDKSEAFENLQHTLEEREQKSQGGPAGRLYYLALPPSVYPQVCKGLKEGASQLPDIEGSWLRIIIEKPFGMDLESSEDLAEDLNKLFPEEQLYRIDHYLGKELMQNMLVMRFANRFISPCWNNQHIANVQIVFKEPFGTEGRGGYFDEFGIIRDVMQNHLLQVLALVAMEKPVSLGADDIRDEKVKVLRCISPVKGEDSILGQYVSNGKDPGYLDDETTPKGSKTPTFAAVKLHIRNDRWEGVPFILKAGKALNERKVEIRLQMRPTVANLWHEEDPNALRNELVMRIQPDEAIYYKLAIKKPGLEYNPVMSELDLSYKSRFKETYIPDAYERLILDAIRGDQEHFVRRDELRAAWAIFTPLLHAIDDGKLEPVEYKHGSRGPPEADELIRDAGFVRNESYVWGDSPRRSAL